MDKNRPIKVALTGGIGSGKSTALGIISALGYKTISLDNVYSDMLRDADFVKSICDIAGIPPAIIGGTPTLDRNAVSKAVFSDKNKLKRLNEFTHGKILNEAFSRGATVGITFYEVPLLFEGGYEKLFDRVLVILRDKKARVAACGERDGASGEITKKIIANQFDYDNCDLSVHTIIRNDGDEAALKDKLERAIGEIEKQINVGACDYDCGGDDNSHCGGHGQLRKN